MSNRVLAKNMLFNVASFLLTMGISFFFTPYLIRVLGVEAYGFFPLANQMIGYSSILTVALNSMAGRFIVMRYYQHDYAGASRYFTTVFVGNVVLALLLALPSYFVVAYMGQLLHIPAPLESSVKLLFAFILASTFIGLVGSIYSVPTFIKNRIDLSSSRNALLNLLRVLLLIALFTLFPPSLPLIGVVTLVISILGLLTSLHFKRLLTPELELNLSKHFSWSALKELVGSGIWNSFNQLSILLMTQLDLLITNLFVGAAATGQFSLAKTLPGIIQSFVSVIAGTFAPQLTIYYAQNRIDLIIQEINKSIRLLGLLISLPLGFLLVYGQAFFQLWVPTQDAAFLQALSVLSLIPIILTGSINTIYGVYSMTNKLRTPALVWFVLGVVQVALVYALFQLTDYGIWIIPVVSLVLGLSRNLLFTPLYAARCLQLKWYQFYLAIGRGFLSSFISIGLSYLGSLLYTPHTWGTFLAAGVLLSSLSFSLCFFLFIRRSERRYLLTQLQRLLKR